MEETAFTTRRFTYFPKSEGNEVNDMSFNPNTVRLFSCANPAGSRGIGFELKSATCKLRKYFMSSGMSCISVCESKRIQTSASIYTFLK